MTKLTGEASRAARGLLRWSMRDLAEQSGVSLPTLLKMENGGNIAEDTADKIKRAFDMAGVEILNGDAPGARFKPGARQTG